MRSGDLVLRPGEHETVLVPDPLRPRAFTLRVGRTDQSYVDLDDPTRLEFDYVQRVVDVVEAVHPAGERLTVVHVGGAGLTLPRYLAHTRPRSAQVVLEPDTELTELVRAHLPLPRQSGIKVRASDGLSGLAALRDDHADVVVLDAFDGAQVPAELTTDAFLADVRRVLAPTGTLVANVTDRGPFDYARRVLAGVLATFRHAVLCAEPSTLKGRRFGNVVLAAADVELPVAEIARRAGTAPYPYRVLHGLRLTQLVGRAAPFTGAGLGPVARPAERPAVRLRGTAAAPTLEPCPRGTRRHRTGRRSSRPRARRDRRIPSSPPTGRRPTRRPPHRVRGRRRRRRTPGTRPVRRSARPSSPSAAPWR